MQNFFVSINETDEKSLNLTFTFKLPNGVEREFNMSRKSSEPISTSVQRMKSNILKAANKKKKGLSVTNPDDINVQVFKSADAWTGESACGDVFTNPATSIKIGDIDYKILINSPTVKQLKLNSTILTGYPTMPVVDCDFCDPTQCQFTWYKQLNAEHPDLSCKKRKRLTSLEFVKAGEGRVFVPDEDCEGCRLKVVCLPSNGTEVGHPVESVSNAVMSGPKQCHFLESHKLTSQVLGPKGY